MATKCPFFFFFLVTVSTSLRWNICVYVHNVLVVSYLVGFIVLLENSHRVCSNCQTTHTKKTNDITIEDET